MNRVVISGYYGFDNIGDEAILKGIVHSLRQTDKELEIVVLSSRPHITSKRYKVRAINRNNIFSLVKVIRNSDLFISGGGSLLQDVTSWRTIPYYLGLVFLAKIFGKKTCFYAQGIGPINNRLNRFLTRIVANRVDLITVRDKKSQNFLIELGVKPNLIKITSDPVFSLYKKVRKRNILQGVVTDKTGPLIGISVRPWKDNKYLKKVAEAADYLVNLSGGQAVIIPMHYHQDQEVSQKLMDLMNSKATLLSDNYNPDEMLSIYAELDFLLGVRLHSLIFAVLNNIPFVAISYDPKVNSFLEMLGLRSIISIDNINLRQLKDIIKAGWENRKMFVNSLEYRAAELEKLAFYNSVLVLDLL